MKYIERWLRVIDEYDRRAAEDVANGLDKSLEGVFVETVNSNFCGHVLSSTVRPATKEDVENAKKLNMQGQCPHNVIVDTPAWLYDIRTCFICGKGLGAI